MTIIDLIDKKRRGVAHTPEEIAELVRLITSGEAQDCQVAAWLMAACIQGLDPDETFALTRELVASGSLLDLSAVDGVVVDKHSTGGVGDKTTLILLPLLASAGLKVAKLSGRSLAYTGGTIDKLEAIPGFNVRLSNEAFIRQVREIGVAISSQTAELSPAEGRMYALRDVTATVQSIPLIASSVMSKKIAAGAEIIILDIKAGSGAFMKNPGDAGALAAACRDIGLRLGKSVSTVISGMDQPLGLAVGNRLEVREALNVLKGDAPPDLLALCLKLGGLALVCGGESPDLPAAENLLMEKIQSGAALEKLLELVTAQGGDADFLRNGIHSQRAANVLTVRFEGIPDSTESAYKSAYISGIDALTVAKAAVLAGAGRLTKDAPIDPDAGILLRGKVGSLVRQGDVLAELHIDGRDPAESLRMLSGAFSFTPQPVDPPPLIHQMTPGPAGCRGHIQGCSFES